MACPNKHRVRFHGTTGTKTKFLSPQPKRHKLASDSPCFPELTQYKNLTDCGKEMRVVVNTGKKNRSSVILLRTNSAHTVVCFAKLSFRQSKHLQMDFGLKSACCCQPKRFTPKIRLAVNALLGAQWKQMHVYALQILK